MLPISRLPPKIFAAYGLLAVLCIIFVFTQTWADINSSQELGFSDTRSYIAIANCPIFEVCDIGRLYPNHHLERWLPNVLAGELTKILGIELHRTYLTLMWIILIASVLICIWVRESHANSIILISTIIFFPYIFRSFFFAPAMIADALFMFAVISLVLSIAHSNAKLLYLACILGPFCRQTGLIFIPIIIIAGLYGKLPVRETSAGGILIAAMFFLNQYISQKIYGAMPESTISHAFGLFQWIKDGSNLDESAVFISRLGFFFILLAPVLLIHRSPGRTKLAIICFLLLAIQPLMAGPSITGGNIQRLLAFGVPFIYLSLPQSEVKATNDLLYYVFFSGILSLHHNYAMIFNQRIYFWVSIIVFVFSFVLFKLNSTSGSAISAAQ